MEAQEVLDRIANLDVSAKAKAELLMLWHKARHIVEGLLKFVKRYREIAEALLAGALGVLKQLRADIGKLFEAMPA